MNRKKKGAGSGTGAILADITGRMESNPVISSDVQPLFICETSLEGGGTLRWVMSGVW